MCGRVQATAGPHREVTPVLHVWRVEREGEDERFSCHDSITNRRLLWHGTNVAVGTETLSVCLRVHVCVCMCACMHFTRWH